MRVTLDRSGRLLIPATLRRAAGLQPGTRVDVSIRDGHIEVKPAPVPVRLERRGRLLVAVAQESVPPLSADTVERTRQSLLARHGVTD